MRPKTGIPTFLTMAILGGIPLATVSNAVPYRTPPRFEVPPRGVQTIELSPQQKAFYRLQDAVSQRHNGKFNVDFFRNPQTRDMSEMKFQHLVELRDIRVLKLRACTGVGDKQMRHVGKIHSVEYLDLHSTDVADAGVAQLAELANVKQLDLSLTAVTDDGLAKLDKLRSLNSLRLNGSRVTKQGVEAFRAKREDVEVVFTRAYTPEQRKAAVALARMAFFVDEDLDPYVKPKTAACRLTIPPYVKLRDPAAADTKAAPRDPLVAPAPDYAVDPATVAELIANLPGPIAVDVRQSTMDDTIFTCLRNARQLIRLNIAQTQVTDLGMAELRQHPDLRVLDLEYAKKVSDAGILHLTSLNNLQQLKMRGVKSTPEALAQLLELKHLQTLSILRKQSTPHLNSRFKRKGVHLFCR